MLLMLVLAAAWAEPTSYRGIPWGASVAEAREKIGKAEWCRCSWGAASEFRQCAFRLADPANPPALRDCRFDLDVAGVKVQDFLLFDREAFSGVLMSFDSGAFDTMRDVFVEKYGKPTSIAASALSNAMGASFTNTTLTWKGRAVTITLQRYEDRITEGGASILRNDYWARRTAARKRQARESF